jgi:hypothetical protein
MPAGYAALAYGRLDRYFANLANAVPPGSAPEEQVSLWRQIRTAAAATKFENGKIRDVLFVGMPKIAETGDLTRSSLSLGTKDSFLYVAMLIDWQRQFAWPNPTATAAAGVPTVLRQLAGVFGQSGITRAEWGNAFGPEIGVVGNWPENSRIPSLIATFPVKDSAAANRIIAAMTTAAPDESAWTVSTREGVQYYSLPPANPMVPITPTVAVGEQVAIAGLDPISVEAATKRAGGQNSELAASQTFTRAGALVPPAKQSFTYVDTALLYSRLDTALRPMLVMSAAFMPNIAQNIDLAKLPAPDVITRHLSPTVISQNYEGDGYVSESIGPLPTHQAVLGFAVATGAGAALYQRQLDGGGAASDPLAAPTPAMPPVPSPALPSPSPEGGEAAPESSRSASLLRQLSL